MVKSEIRALYKKKRTELSPNELERISSQVNRLVMDSFSFCGKYISLFLPIEKHSEMNTFALLDEILITGGFPVLSKSNFEDNTLSLFLYEDPKQLVVNSFGIPEPQFGTNIPEQKLDIVFVPLLAVNDKGQRVGYGKGFYDRMLAKCRPDCSFVGLHLFDEFVEIDDLHSEDIPLDFCITPQQKYDFR